VRQIFLNTQYGAVTLFMSVILLIAITLVTFLTAKTVLQETKMVANNYRAIQASNAAEAAMEYAIAYFKKAGFDQIINETSVEGSDGHLDYSLDANIPTEDQCVMPNTTAFPISLVVADTQTTFARFYFDNTPDNRCDTDTNGDGTGNVLSTSDMSQGMIVAQGWSDDCTAVRTLSQCVVTAGLFGNNGKGPEQPFISRASIGVMDNAKIINRYSDTSLWVGNELNISGTSMVTYLRPFNTTIDDLRADYPEKSEDEFKEDILMINDASIEAQQVPEIDVITVDSTLSNKSSTEFFNIFFDPYNLFAGTAKIKIKNLAIDEGQMLTSSSDDLNGLSGLIWIDGDTRISEQTIVGTIDKPTVLIIDGNFDMTGGVVNGVVYVMGELNIAGNPIIRGSLVSESGLSSGEGALDLVFVPFDSTGNGFKNSDLGVGETTVPGTWRDW
jgi:hypothetical protein